MNERVHERRPMATSTMIGLAGLALSLAITIGGLIATYGAWARSEGKREAYVIFTDKQIEKLEAAKEAGAVQIALLNADKEAKTKAADMATNKYDELRAYVQALTIRMAQSGVRDLPPPPP